MKSNRQCEGYRNEADTIFRDQSAHVIARATVDSHGRPTTKKESFQLQQSKVSGNTNVTHTYPSNLNVPTLTRSPKPNEKDVLTRFFANNFTSGESIERRTNLFWIPQNFDSFLKDESVNLSVQCTGAMAIARLRGSPEYSRRAQKQYGQALLSVSERWRHRTETENGATFLAVIFLSFFEVLASHDTSSRQGWITHLGGLGGLFLRCQKQFLSTEFGAKMFRQTRSQIILHAIQSRTPVSGPFADPTHSDHNPSPLIFKHFDDADALLIRLAKVQADCSTSAPSSSLISDLTILDRDLAGWAETLPPLWSFSAQPSKPPSGLWWDARCDIYVSGFVAHAWNKVRAARIVTYDLTQIMLSRIAPQDTGNLKNATPQTTNVYPNPKIQQLATDICATIPTYYRPPCVSTEGREADNPPPLGTIFWFLWVLEVVGTMTEAPRELTDWVVHCFERIYQTTGILMARRFGDRVRTRQRGPVLP